MVESGDTMTEPAFSLRKDDLVTLLVGPQEEEFAVHESCITRNSDFFKAALKKQWVEGQTRIIKLPEETCTKSFANYLNFAYHEKLPTEGVKIVADDKPFKASFDALGKIYVIGERVLDRSVQRAVVREFMRLTTITMPGSLRVFPGESTIALIYDGTSTGSPIRRMMVDFYVTCGTTNWPYVTQHPEFLGELAGELQGKVIAQRQHATSAAASWSLKTTSIREVQAFGKI